MRRRVTCLICMCVGGWLLAGGMPFSPVQPSARKIAQDEADAYGQDLLRVVREISGRYVRPIPASKLVAAALTELHEAAQVAAPAALEAELEQAAAKTDVSSLTTLPTTRWPPASTGLRARRRCCA